MKRVGMVIGLRDENETEYRRLHDGPGVRDLLAEANIRNFTIYLTRMPDGRLYEFAHYEYVGKDYDADMAYLATHPRNIEWLALCDPMQVPLPGADGWQVMEEIFHNA